MKDKLKKAAAGAAMPGRKKARKPSMPTIAEDSRPKASSRRKVLSKRQAKTKGSTSKVQVEPKRNTNSRRKKGYRLGEKEKRTL